MNCSSFNNIADFVRGDVTDQSDASEGESFTTELTCKCLRLMPYRFQTTEPVSDYIEKYSMIFMTNKYSVPLQVTFTSKGVRIAGILENKDEKFVLNIYKREVIKVIAHFGSSEQAQPLVTLYMLKTCAQYVKAQLKLPDDPPNERE